MGDTLWPVYRQSLLEQIASERKDYDPELKSEHTPYISSESDRFLPKQNYPSNDIGIGDFLSNSLLKNMNATGGYHPWSNSITLPPDLNKTDPVNLEVLSHEYSHYRFNQNSEYKRMYSRMLFGGEEQHNKFIDDLSDKLGTGSNYNIRDKIPIWGRRIKEDETLAYLVGKIANGRASQEQVLTNLNKLHPNASKWWDLHTKDWK